ncbi:pogo transposable element with znf domain, partial [Plakobranchus ocellatus]
VHSNKANVLLCRICEKDHDTRYSLKEHMRRNHNACEMPYSCQLCMFRSSMYSDVVDHFKKKHANSSSLLCLYCLKVVNVRFISQGWAQTLNYYNHLVKHQNLEGQVTDTEITVISFVKGKALTAVTQELSFRTRGRSLMPVCSTSWAWLRRIPWLTLLRVSNLNAFETIRARRPSLLRDSDKKAFKNVLKKEPGSPQPDQELDTEAADDDDKPAEGMETEKKEVETTAEAEMDKKDDQSAEEKIDTAVGQVLEKDDEDVDETSATADEKVEDAEEKMDAEGCLEQRKDGEERKSEDGEGKKEEATVMEDKGVLQTCTGGEDTAVTQQTEPSKTQPVGEEEREDAWQSDGSNKERHSNSNVHIRPSDNLENKGQSEDAKTDDDSKTAESSLQSNLIADYGSSGDEGEEMNVDKTAATEETESKRNEDTMEEMIPGTDQDDVKQERREVASLEGENQPSGDATEFQRQLEETNDSTVDSQSEMPTNMSVEESENLNEGGEMLSGFQAEEESTVDTSDAAYNDNDKSASTSPKASSVGGRASDVDMNGDVVGGQPRSRELDVSTLDSLGEGSSDARDWTGKFPHREINVEPGDEMARSGGLAGALSEGVFVSKEQREDTEEMLLHSSGREEDRSVDSTTEVSALEIGHPGEFEEDSTQPNGSMTEAGAEDLNEDFSHEGSNMGDSTGEVMEKHTAADEDSTQGSQLSDSMVRDTTTSVGDVGEMVSREAASPIKSLNSENRDDGITKQSATQGDESLQNVEDEEGTRPEEEVEDSYLEQEKFKAESELQERAGDTREGAPVSSGNDQEEVRLVGVEQEPSAMSFTSEPFSASAESVDVKPSKSETSVRSGESRDRSRSRSRDRSRHRSRSRSRRSRDRRSRSRDRRSRSRDRRSRSRDRRSRSRDRQRERDWERRKERDRYHRDRDRDRHYDRDRHRDRRDRSRDRERDRDRDYHRYRDDRRYR